MFGSDFTVQIKFTPVLGLVKVVTYVSILLSIALARASILEHGSWSARIQRLGKTQKHCIIRLQCGEKEGGVGTPVTN